MNKKLRPREISIESRSWRGGSVDERPFMLALSFLQPREGLVQLLLFFLSHERGVLRRVLPVLLVGRTLDRRLGKVEGSIMWVDIVRRRMLVAMSVSVAVSVLIDRGSTSGSGGGGGQSLRVVVGG